MNWPISIGWDLPNAWLEAEMPKRIGWWATTMIFLLGLTWVGLFAVEKLVPHDCWRVVPMEKGK